MIFYTLHQTNTYATCVLEMMTLLVVTSQRNSSPQSAQPYTRPCSGDILHNRRIQISQIWYLEILILPVKLVLGEVLGSHGEGDVAPGHVDADQKAGGGICRIKLDMLDLATTAFICKLILNLGEYFYCYIIFCQIVFDIFWVKIFKSDPHMTFFK